MNQAGKVEYMIRFSRPLFLVLSTISVPRCSVIHDSAICVRQWCILKPEVITATSRLLRLGIENAGVCPLRTYKSFTLCRMDERPRLAPLRPRMPTSHRRRCRLSTDAPVRTIEGSMIRSLPSKLRPLHAHTPPAMKPEIDGNSLL